MLGLNKNKKNFVKIIGGHWKRKNIYFQNSEVLRPTLGRVRETLFNWLNQDLTNKYCLDLFAGTGALGFEALSRNASSCLMVEKNKDNFLNLEKNKEALGAYAADIIHSSANTFLKTNSKKFDIIFFDPPFMDKDAYKSIDDLAKYLNNDGLIYLELGEEIRTRKLKILKSSRAGQVYFYLLTMVSVHDRFLSRKF